MSPMNAVVTGANRGLGLELCRQLAAKPAYGNVYALCRHSNEALSSLMDSNNENKIRIVENVDVTSDTVASTLQETFHNNDKDAMIPIDLVIHNAGAYGPGEFESASDMYESQTLENITAERLQHAFSLNSVAPLLVTKALLPNLRAAARGKVIIISSAMGSIADNTSGGHYGYRAAKAAINMIGTSLAVDLKDDGIAVGLVHPGFVLTGFDGGRERRPGQRDADESATGVLQAVDQISMETTGNFLHGNYGEGVLPMQW